jgi:hypothetical protein
MTSRKSKSERKQTSERQKASARDYARKRREDPDFRVWKKEQDRLYREKVKADPVLLAAHRKYHREVRRENYQDPRYAEKSRAASKKALANRLSDPIQRSLHNEKKVKRRAVAVAQNPDEVRRKQVNYCLQHQYGMTLEQRDELLAEQGGKCLLCFRETDFPASQKGRSMRSAHIDHCHNTGVVRGILCGWCNTGLGRFGDDPERLKAAAAYLEADRPNPKFKGTTKPKKRNKKPGLY